MAARKREEEARRQQYARRTRANDDGMAAFCIRAAFPVIARLDATVDYLATMLGEIGVEASVDELRVLAIAVLSNPPYATELLAHGVARGRGRRGAPSVDWSKLLPQVKLFVHTYRGVPDADDATDTATRIARIEGYGAVTDAWVRDPWPDIGRRCVC